MKYLWSCRRTFTAIAGMASIVVCTRWGHPDVSGDIALICVAVAGSNAAQHIFLKKFDEKKKEEPKA